MRIHAQVGRTNSPALEGARDVAKALADTNRLRILAALAGRELCVCHLTGMLEVDASTVSRHVSVLRRAGLVTVRKDGRWLHCRRAEDAHAVFELVDALLANAPERAEDARALDCVTGC